MKDVTVSLNSREFKVDEGTSLFEIIQKHKEDFWGEILCAKVNNEIVDLSTKIIDNSIITLYNISDFYGYKTYQRSLAFLFIYAVKEVLGKDKKVVVCHSINKNLFCKIPGCKLNDDIINKIKDKMLQIVKDDIPIERVTIPIDKAEKIYKDYGLENKSRSLRYIRKTNVSLYKLNWYYDYFYGTMVNSTGYLKVFDLVIKEDGVILRLPQKNNPNNVNIEDLSEKTFNIFKETANWNKILKIDTVWALNDKVSQGRIKDIVLVSEALQEKKIACIADSILNNKKKIVLIAGPSSSGKTTFAERLSIALKVNGIRPYIISLDDYYLSRKKIPLNEAGEPDFEDIFALDVKKINEDLKLLVNGEEAVLPKFNFLTGEREEKGKLLKLDKDEVLIIEGIHGLNGMLTQSVNKEDIYRIFISPMTQLNIDEHNRIPTTDGRLIRRIVRDNQFRGFGATNTMGMWQNVLKGEDKNIFPYQSQADVMFNSALPYELGVLKQYAEPILFSIEKDDFYYVEATRLIRFIDSFLPIDSKDIPANSIIREFIGGSCFY